MWIKDSKNYTPIILGAILLGMSSLLFQESFQGLVLQGLDDNISMRAALVRSLQSGQGFHFIPNYWLGFIFNIPNPDFYNTILLLTGSVKVVGVFALALILSGFVTYALLRRLDVSPLASVFGALSYTYLPHVLTLVFSGHALAVESIPMTPAFLLCLAIILDGKSNKNLAKLLASVWAGIFWAWMMIGEPQRGTYGTVLGMAWVLYLLTNTKSIDWKALLKKPMNFISLDILKTKISFLFVTVFVGLVVFFPTINYWTNSEFLSTEGSWEFATSWSFPPQELINTFAYGYHGLGSSDQDFPYYGDKPISENSDSLGFFLLAFALLGMILAWKDNKKALRFFSVAGGLALLLSFGKYFPGSPLFWLWYHIPGMDTMRVPAKFLSITGLSWAIVASMGMDKICEIYHSDKQKLKKDILFVVAAVFCVSLGWLLYLMMTGGGDVAEITKVISRKQRGLVDAALTGRVNAVLSMTTLFAILLGVLAGFYLNNKWAKWLMISLVAVSAFNLYASNRYFIQKTYVNEEKEYPRTPLIDFLQSHLEMEYRASGSLFIPNVNNSPHPMGAVVENTTVSLYPLNNQDLTYSFPYHDINMFGRIPVSRLDEGYRAFFKAAFDSVGQFTNNSDVWEMNRRLWFMGNVKYLLVGQQMEQAFQQELARDAVYVTNVLGSYNQAVSIYELKEKLPRFALINKVIYTDEANIYKEMAIALRDLSNYSLPVEDVGIRVPEALDKPFPLIGQKNNYNSYHFVLEATELDTFFYMGDLYDKGWKALVNDEPVEIFRANGIQQYLYAPMGTTDIVIYYDRPTGGLWGRFLIIFALLGAVVYGIFSCRCLIKNKEN